ncbi:MAG: CehA/McbA family metallohydrolase [Acidobacteriaceae bacterium]
MFCLTSCVAASATNKSYDSAVAKYQDALFHATLDLDGFGRSAIDLYWAANGLRAYNGSAESFEAKLTSLYAGIGGNHIARAELTEAGWKIVSPSRPFILAEGDPYEILLLVSNSSSHSQTITANLQQDVGSWRQQIELAPQQTIALYPRLLANVTGPLYASIELRGFTSARVPLYGEVRSAVRLRVRVLDAAGKVTPARVYLRGADGRSYAPPNSFDRIMWMTGEHFFYMPSNIDIVLPAGVADIEVRKGFEYRPMMRHTSLVAGHVNNVDICLPWLRDMASEGWFSGDDHIHNNYTGDQWSTPEDAGLAVAAEGLHVGNMMVSNGTGNDVHDERYFEGKLNASSTRDELLYWDQEMRSWSYGHLVLLGLKSLVRPIYTGFPGTPNWEDYPSNYQQAEQAHQNGGIAIYAHPALRFGEIPSGSLAGESVVDVALGAIDDFEVFCSHDETSMELWYRFLNLGFHLGISGGSDAFLNNHFSFLAGGERVYVYTGRELTYDAWIGGLKRGRTFATVGPLLTFTVDGRMAGSELRFAEAQRAVPVRIRADSTIPMTRIEIVMNGDIVATASSRTPTEHLQWSGRVPISKSSWIAARIWGPDNDRIANGPSRWSQRRSPSLVLLAHSGPVYISIAGQPILSAADREFCLHWIDTLTARINKEGSFADAAHRNDVLASFARARRIYERMGIERQGENQ